MAKRTNGEGSIFQLRPGIWRAQITIGYDENGKRIEKNKSSKDIEEVKKWLNDERYKLNRNIITTKCDYTLDEWYALWLENYKSHSIKSKTYDNYEINYKRYASEKIGQLKLDKVKPEHIQILYNSMHKQDYSTSTIKHVNTPLTQAFQQAVDNGLIYTNPCKKTTIPKKKEKKSRPLTIEEQSRFLNACTETTYSNFFIFALNTGMRCGEIVALTWDNVDFTEKIIKVEKTADTILNRDENKESKYKIVLDTAKTQSSLRSIPINKNAETVLLEQKAIANSPFVFSSKNGTILMYRNIRRAFNNHVEKAEIKNDVTIHSLRHTFATRLLEKGANVKAISELLGHSSVKITLDVYSHALPNLKKETISMLD